MTENTSASSPDPAASSPDPNLWERPRKGPVGEFFAPVAGYGVTISSMFRPVATEQYPEEPVPVHPRYHGRHHLNRYPDGLEKCIGCELCAWACPADAIFVEAAANDPQAQYSPGERYGRVYQINYQRCIFCGYCMQACPTRALTMSNEFEIAGPTREGLIYEKQDILVPLEDGMLAPPHPMPAGASHLQYYRGEITGPTQSQIDWVREHRPDDPTLATARPVAEQGPAPDVSPARGVPPVAQPTAPEPAVEENVR